jgi:hypothetical protein
MTKTMNRRKSRFGEVRRMAMMIGLTVAVGGLSIGHALAEDGRHDDRARWEHERIDRERWEHERIDRERWEREHRYAAPPVVVAPPPAVVYAPPPVVVAPPSGINIILPIHIR